MAPPKRRRARGEGTITWREDRNCFAATISVGHDQHGARRRKTVYAKTKAELIEKLNALRVQVATGMLAERGGVTVAEHLHQWLENSVKLNRRKNTYVAYEVIVRLHLVPFIGKMRLDKLSAATIQTLYAELAREGRSPATCAHAHRILHKALKVAVMQRRIARNFAADVEKPKAPKRRYQVLDPDQAGKFIMAARKDRLYAMYVLAIATGLRQGELLGLRWEDVNLKKLNLTVQRQMIESKGKLEEGPPKTNAGTRTIVLPEIVAAAIREHRERMLAEGHAHGYVFCDTLGGPIRKGNLLRRSFKPLLKAAKLPDLRFHDLRHSAATLLLGMGVHHKVIQEILGHSNFQITMDLYSHVTPAMMTEPAEKMNNLLRHHGAS